MTRLPSLRASLLRASIAAALFPALLATASAAEPAQDEARAPEPPPQDPKTLSTVEVVGTQYDARRDDTAAKIVVSREDLLRHGDTTLADALKRLPGVTIGAGAPGRGGRAALRGLGGYTQMLVNGQKVPPGFDLESLPPEMVERIEIVRSATADVRTEAIAGTINIILSKAARTDAREVRLGVAASNGRPMTNASWHQSRRGEYRNTTLNASLHRREFLVDETGTETGTDATGAETLRRATTLRTQGVRDALSVAPALNLTLEGGDTLSLQAYLDASRGRRDGDIAWATSLGPELRHVRYDQRIDNDFAQARTDASWTHEFERAGKLATRLVLAANRDDVDFRELGFGADGAQNLDDRTRTHSRTRSAGSTGKYSLPAIAEGHAIELGWEGGIERQDESRVQRLAAIAGQPASVSDLDFDAQVRRLAVYAQDDWTLAPHWSLYLGTRWERIDTTSEGTGFAAVHNRADVLSPIVQSLWKFRGARRDQLRAGLSRTYKSVPARLLVPRPMTSTNNRPLDPDTMGNPALRPELATGLDVAWERYGDAGTQLSLGGYARGIEGIIRNETRLVAERWVSMPVNGGDARAWGLEMDAKFPLARLVPGAPAIDMRFNATRNWSRVEDVPGPGNRLDSQVEFSSTLAADYKAGPTWTVGGSLAYRSGGTVRTSAAQARFDSPRRDVDLYALARLSPKAKLRLGLGNVLGQEDASGSEFFGPDGTLRLERRRDSPLNVRANLEIKL